ncbi:MAG: 2-dehydropantoate 2-reductase [Rhodobacteraceae bacterium HLUCCO07]|nr:MAG: 2-dehydropantoate 2-reductase [Rhodobacteraceae bacterium HLUCCO07]
MRVIIYGVGAVGGAVAAALVENGQEVIGIARGAQLEAIRENGLRVRSPVFDRVVALECVSDPGEIAFREDDAILLCMKTQDTAPALEALRAAGVDKQPIFCAQNGVENERIALRVFPNVHGITVMLPALLLAPGDVVTWGEPQFGYFDIGRYPHGHDADDVRLAEAFRGSKITPFVLDDVMSSKYRKLLHNVGNITQAALGRGVDTGEIGAALKDEARAVYDAHGIKPRDGEKHEPERKELMRFGTIEGIENIGGSTAQSLARGAGSVETDYLNGEISLMGRLASVPTPVNDAMTRLGARLAREGVAPGSMTLDDLRRLVG